jgi:hypothetical protein
MTSAEGSANWRFIQKALYQRFVHIPSRARDFCMHPLALIPLSADVL